MRRDLSLVQLCAAVFVVTAAAEPQWQDVIRNLRHPSADTRLAAVERLERGGYVAAMEPLAPLLADADDRVQAAAIDAELTFFLADRMGDRRMFGVGGSKSRAHQAFDAGPLVRTAAPAPRPVVDGLIAAMRDENARVRFDAVHALGFVAEAPLAAGSLAALADELDHYDPVIRAATARVLGRLGERGAGDRLLAALDDSSEIVRQFAVEALGRIREDRALPRLRDLIHRAGSRNVDGLALALARIGAPDDAAWFRARLVDRSAAVRRAAAEGLGRTRTADALEEIASLASADRSAEVRLAAAFALDRLGRGQSHVIAAALADDDLAGQAREYLFEIGPAAVPGAIAALGAATASRHRADLVQTIGYLGASAHLDVVRPLFTDRDGRVARAATAAAERLKRAGDSHR
jgi:HEAT repeat protein